MHWTYPPLKAPTGLLTAAGASANRGFDVVNVRAAGEEKSVREEKEEAVPRVAVENIRDAMVLLPIGCACDVLRDWTCFSCGDCVVQVLGGSTCEANPRRGISVVVTKQKKVKIIGEEAEGDGMERPGSFGFLGVGKKLSPERRSWRRGKARWAN